METVSGELASLALIAAVFIVGLWVKRRRRQKLRDRPPQEIKLLRPPGFGLQFRISELNAQADWTLAQLLAAAAILGISSSGSSRLWFDLLKGDAPIYMLEQPPVFIVAAAPVLALGWAVWCIIHLWKLHEAIRNCRLGLRGEQAVAEALSAHSLTSRGYKSFHDVPGDGPWNVDHVVIGPAGLFVLETKTRSKRKSLNGQKESEVVFDGRTLQFPWCRDDDAAVQVARNAEWIRRFIKGFAPEGLVIQPIVIIPGWYVSTTEKTRKCDILGMNQNYLTGYLAREPKRFSAQELLPLVSRFDERCRDLEF